MDFENVDIFNHKEAVTGILMCYWQEFFDYVDQNTSYAFYDLRLLGIQGLINSDNANAEVLVSDFLELYDLWGDLHIRISVDKEEKEIQRVNSEEI